MTNDLKTKRYTMRMSPQCYERIKNISKELRIKMPDLLVTGALTLYARATSQAAFYAAKAESVECPSPPLREDT
jgi:hypothetical protein